MQVQVEQLEPCKVALHVEIEPERVNEVRDKAFREVSPYVEVPGFRRGKAPKNLIQRYMNADILRRHTLSLLVPSALDEAVKESGLEMYDEPEIADEPELTADEPVKFTATFSTPPKVELGPYTGLRIEFPALEVQEEDVNRSLDQLREQRASLRAVDRAAQEGDFVAIDYTLHVGGEDDSSGPMLRVAGASDDPIDQALLGKSAGDALTVEAPVQGDEEKDEEKQGAYSIIIKEVRNWVVPELDDEFARSVGFDTVDALRASVRERLQKQADEMARDDIEERLLNAVREHSTIVYPNEIVDRMAGNRMESLLAHLDDRDLTLEDYLEHEKKTLTQLEGELSDVARRIVENQLMLAEIAREQKIHVTEAQVAQELGAEPTEGEDPEAAHQRAANRVVYRQILDFLAHNNDLVPQGGTGEPAAPESPEGEAGREARKEGGWISRLFRRRGHEEAPEGPRPGGDAEPAAGGTDASAAGEAGGAHSQADETDAPDADASAAAAPAAATAAHEPQESESHESQESES